MSNSAASSLPSNTSPLLAETRTAPVSATATAPGPRKPGILVVDDEPHLRLILEVILDGAGFAVWTSADGTAALDLYRHQQHKIDLILLDIRMPGMDGLQTLHALKKIDAQVCCCFLSGSTGDYALDDLLAAGALRVFVKPFTPNRLITQLRQLLDWPTERGSNASVL